jgi:hypothetical protein
MSELRLIFVSASVPRPLLGELTEIHTVNVRDPKGDLPQRQDASPQTVKQHRGRFHSPSRPMPGLLESGNSEGDSGGQQCTFLVSGRSHSALYTSNMALITSTMALTSVFPASLKVTFALPSFQIISDSTLVDPARACCTHLYHHSTTPPSSTVSQVTNIPP